ncbi:TetR/AcrR family transcriptional regulator [Promicromonospora citrea]|uniref:TetR family transcriptional regulator n=1 Tax=Promicromonospora citrea TaxID=43677 RepID=A0A8H9L7E5_9MICO|nr:TetR/AcrR family transcriptional regulator [Promicromonospora citrea]NNH52244.1 TetR/AcrR family transcriptional regulator [Promicromonospora citrea]GGM40109.1 TetR family transcriptional regulator [Promicromonospora citrea]
MSLNERSDAGPQRRRRGAALEGALLDAAWAELVATGYEAMTYDAVAERASTSRAVLYRRWPSKRDLAAAAVARVVATIPFDTPDTGSLRDDVVALLHAANDTRARIAVQLAVRLDGTGDDALTLADLRTTVAERSNTRMITLLERAAERGEIATADLPRRVRNVAFDLLGYQILATQRAATPAEIEEIVDDVLLPLLRAPR